MATMEYAVVTEAGLALQAKLATGTTMTFTKFVTGKGSVSPVLLQKQTDVTEPEQEFLFSDKPYYSEEYPGEVVITMVMTNTIVKNAYHCSQIGIYANDPDDGEILYALLQTSEPFLVPTETESGGWSTEFEIMMKYGGADAVNIYVNAAGMLTRQAADRRYMQKISYNGKLYEFARDENGVYLQEIEDTSGEATDVIGISEKDMEMLHELFVENDEWEKEVEELKKSVSDGKALVAGAITEKGIETAADATFATMSSNILDIETGVDTSDANVTADKMLQGYSGYANGVKVNGNIPITTPTKTISGKSFIDGSFEEFVVWEKGTLSASTDTKSVCYGNGMFVAVSVNTANMACSTDGINWTTGTMTESGSWQSVCYGNGMFVAVGNRGSAYSTDGINWTKGNLSSSYSMGAVCYGNGMFVAVSTNGDAYSAYSTDGINWTMGTMPNKAYWDSVCYGNGVFLAVSYVNSKVYNAYSTDGINWTTGTMPESVWREVCYGNGMFVAISATSVACSTDGINWTMGTIPESGVWNSVCYGNGMFVAVAYSSANVAYSTDGINWTMGTMSESARWDSVCYGNGMFVAVASRTTTSARGSFLRLVSIPANTYLDGVGYVRIPI